MQTHDRSPLGVMTRLDCGGFQKNLKKAKHGQFLSAPVAGDIGQQASPQWALTISPTHAQGPNGVAAGEPGAIAEGEGRVGAAEGRDNQGKGVEKALTLVRMSFVSGKESRRRMRRISMLGLTLVKRLYHL